MKDGGDNNNSEATNKDDDQSYAMGVSKSTAAELAKAQGSSKKRFSMFQESWKTSRPWLELHEKENAMF